MKRYFLVSRNTRKVLAMGFMSREQARAAKRTRGFKHDIWDSQSEQVVR